MNQASETHLVRTPVTAPQKASVANPAIPSGNGSETCFVGAMPVGSPRPAAAPAANNGGETQFVGAMPVGMPRPVAVPAANSGGETQFVGAMPVGSPRPAAAPAANNGGETQFVGAMPVGVPGANNGGETQFVGSMPVGSPRPATVPAANNGGETQFVGAESSIPAVPAAATQPEAFQPTVTHDRGQDIPQAPKQGSTAIPSAAAAPVSTAPLPNGTLLDSNRYEILGFMGQGGFGITYKARHKRMGRECVIKESFPKAFVGRAEDGHTVVLKDSSYGGLVVSINESFLNEALNIVELIKGHDGGYPNLINAIDAFEANGTAYYVMDYIHGNPLTKLMDDKAFFEDSDWAEGRLNLKLEKKLESLLLQVLEGLEVVHNKNITHLDIKPDNIMIKSDGNPVLIDFGASRSTANKQDNQLQFASFGYAPPEQREQGHEHEIGACSDIYALGATFYHLLTGKCPDTEPQPLQQMDASQVHGVSRAFRAAIDRAMQLAPKNRWESATKWKELLLDMQKAKENAIKLHEGR